MPSVAAAHSRLALAPNEWWESRVWVLPFCSLCSPPPRAPSQRGRRLALASRRRDHRASSTLALRPGHVGHDGGGDDDDDDDLATYLSCMYGKRLRGPAPRGAKSYVSGIQVSPGAAPGVGSFVGGSECLIPLLS